MKTYKIVCICQVYNELEKGNLQRFFKYVRPAVDYIIIYDDCSTDGSYEYALQNTSYVIRGVKNDFSDEISHRQKMIEEALKLNPDFILWLDADEVLTKGAPQKLQELCAYCDKNRLDGLNLKELNLWRSSTWRRTDSYYDDGWFTRLWKVKPGIGFAKAKKGLHQSLVPPNIVKIRRANNLAVLHYGFASEKSLSYKYLIYKSHGQRGYKMLDRIISEESLELAPVGKEQFLNGLWKRETKPEKLSLSESFSYVESYKDQVFRPKYSIACLIYKSVDWLDFVYRQVLKYTDMKDTEFFFVANDADHSVLEYLRNNHIPYYEFNNTLDHKKEWYINNVYRAYNYAAKVARGDFLILINSDMAFTPGWVDSLISAYNGHNLVSSRLVESGKLGTGTHGIERDFGKTYSEYGEADFQSYAKSLRENKVIDSGLFMPLLVNKKHFIKVCGYPEGNITKGSPIFNPTIAKEGDLQVSGDNVLMLRMKTIKIQHQTALDSVVYHFQCGEKDEQNTSKIIGNKSEVAVVNDIVTGSMGERVLWDYLIDSIPSSYGVDKRLVGEVNFEKKAQTYIKREHPDTSIVIQNATFIGAIDSSRFTIAFLQDDLRLMGRQSSQQEANLRLAKVIVTNSIQTSLSYPEYDLEIIPVGVDSNLFSPKDKQILRKKYGFGEGRVGIFVGSFSEVKGWSKIIDCIKKFPKITWIVVSKYDEHFQASNARVFNRINQSVLSDLLNCADFFIIGSPVETQCLAAIEANLCNLPVVMPLVGIYRDFTPDERDKVGVFGDDLVEGVAAVLKLDLKPRELIIKKGLSIDDSLAKWQKLIEKSTQEIHIKKIGSVETNPEKTDRLTYDKYRLEFLIRKYIFLPVFGRRHLNTKNWLSITGVKLIVYKVLVKFNLLKFTKMLLRRK